MKKFKTLGGLSFNLLSGALITLAIGLPAFVFPLLAFLFCFIPGAPAGSLSMAVTKEIWMNSIIEGLFADNSFLSKAFNADEFVEQGKTVHIPNSGAASSVTKNRSSYPATAQKRTDTDLTFDLDEFTTDPIHIPNAETVELSYNKRESVIRQDKAAIIESASEAILYSWLPASTYSILTTGASVAPHTSSATGYRKALVKADVLRLMNKFNEDNVPQVGRYLVLDAVMYGQLLESLTEKESQAFFATADVQKGILGQLLSFNIMMRSRVGVYTGPGVKKLWSAAGAATDRAAGIAFYTNSVCAAKGEVKMFENIDDPTFYGDVYSFLVRAGGRNMRSDVKGLVAIIQTDVEATSTDLSALALSAGSIVPAFDVAQRAYTLSVANATTSTTITATAGVTGQVIKLGTTTLTSGTASASKSLAVGENVFTLKITSKDGTMTSFIEIIVTRAAE